MSCDSAGTQQVAKQFSQFSPILNFIFKKGSLGNRDYILFILFHIILFWFYIFYFVKLDSAEY